MKAIPKLKDDARKHEQKEEWEKAIQAYLQVLSIGESGDGAELDLPLYNRVGDLYVRLGRPGDAVKYYEKAADRYAEAGLYNNAIALCNKALRYDAGRLELLKKLGSFSAAQGFFTDARRWYLEFAEKSIKRGQHDDALSALSELADVSDDAEIREMLARQLRDVGRNEQAIEAYKRAYSQRITAGQQAEADAIRDQVLAIDPDADLSGGDGSARTRTTGFHSLKDQLPGYEDASVAVAEAPEAEAEPEEPSVVGGDDLVIEQTAVEGGLDTGGADYGSIDLDQGLGGDAVDTADVEPLEDMGLEAPAGAEALEEEEEATEDEAEGAFDLPLLAEEDATEPEEEEEPAAELPGFEDFGEYEEPAETPVDLPGFGEPEEIEPAADLTSLEAADVEAIDVGEVDRDETGLAGGALPMLEEEPAAPPPPPPPPPPAARQKPKGDYVDLASFLGDDDESAEDSTRFVVAEKPPTGDEEKDFADMLQQFKEKVAETIPKEDAGSHYDLGIAFKEMGLVDEAIAEFQTALRGGQEKLKVYEELGSCFIQKQQYSVAVTVLNRAAGMPHTDEQELLGVYYNLGRAHEELGQRAEAKAAYEKIVAIDISFQDTTDRLARL
jgi:tetratricopeptide (TPR) repeat protein